MIMSISATMAALAEQGKCATLRVECVGSLYVAELIAGTTDTGRSSVMATGIGASATHAIAELALAVARLEDAERQAARLRDSGKTHN